MWKATGMDLFERLKDLLTDRYWFEGMSDEERREVTAPDRYPAFKAQKKAEEAAQFEELLAVVRVMSLEEGKAVAQAAIAYHDTDPDDTEFNAEEILGYLVNFVPGALADVHHAILDRQMTWANGFLFFGADASVRDRMLTLLDTGVEDDRFRDELVCGLAWIGDEIVQRRFAEWRLAPQPWETRYAKAADFTRTGGWELTDDGKRRNLYFPQSYSFISVDEATPEQMPGPVAVATYGQERCRWCERPLLTLFDIDLTDPRMALLGVDGIRLRLGMCRNCSPIFLSLDFHGHLAWSDTNPQTPPDDLYRCADEDLPSLPERSLVLREPLKTLVETIARYWDPGLTQLGGLPEWLQDEAYPDCPECQQTMRFVAQLEPVDLIWQEGIIYAFACFECGISTTGYQQT
jgi:hypothetical protein